MWGARKSRSNNNTTSNGASLKETRGAVFNASPLSTTPDPELAVSHATAKPPVEVLK